jgi:hypothetical protein
MKVVIVGDGGVGKTTLRLTVDTTAFHEPMPTVFDLQDAVVQLAAVAQFNLDDGKSTQQRAAERQMQRSQQRREKWVQRQRR